MTENGATFDLFRISKAKKTVDLSPNSVRKLHIDHGLPIYYQGKNAFVSKSELHHLIIRTASSEAPPKTPAQKAVLKKNRKGGSK